MHQRLHSSMHALPSPETDRSSGKTIVYEILALHRLVSTNKPFVLVYPTVILCEQRVSL